MLLMRLFLQTHKWGVSCAFLSGIIMVLPQLMLPLSLGSQYQGVQPLMLDDEDIYRARIHEILEGNTRVASPYLHEYKNIPVIVPPINEWFYALPAFIIGLSATIIFAKFFFPAALFFFAYLLLWKLIGVNKKEPEITVIAGAFLVVLGTDLIDYGHLLEIMRGISGFKAMMWERIVNPITGGVELLAFLFFMHKALHGSRWSAVFAGVILATTVGYFFTFALSMSITGVLAFIYIVTREYVQVKQLLIIFTVSILLDIPYVHSMLSSIGGVDGRIIAGRSGMEFTHEFIINKMLLASTILFLFALLYVFKKKILESHRDSWIFTSALITGSWVAFNHQVLTGREIWYHHFVQYVIPLSFIALIFAGYNSVRVYIPRVWNVAMHELIIICVAYGLFTSWIGALPYKGELLKQQSFSEVFNIINNNTDACVALVLSDSESLEKAIPAYTNCDVYSTSYVFIGVPHERVLHNLFIKMRLEGIVVQDAESYLLAHEEEVRQTSFENWRQLSSKERDEWFFTAVEREKKGYADFSLSNLKESLLLYRMDYLVSDAPLHQAVIEQLPGLQLIAITNGNFYIYTFK